MIETPSIEQRSAQPYAAIAASVTMDTLGTVLPQLWPETAQWLTANGVDIAGAPFIRYSRVDMAANLEIEVGIPTSTLAVGDGHVVCGELPAGAYAVATHVGPYDELVAANAALQDWAAAQQVPLARELDGSVEVWAARLEFYVTDPQTQPDPARWQTRIEYKTQT